ncbi:SYNE1, partial [Branchiostoma lanceolatum]
MSGQRKRPPLFGSIPRSLSSQIGSRRDEQEEVQKRTFTNWINSHLMKHDPPLKVQSICDEFKDGIKLLALLEVLSGDKLPCEKGRHLKRLHHLTNIQTALQYLEARNIKLVNINPSDVADGKPTIVLGLVWTIILRFQIEDLTALLASPLGSSASSLDSGSVTGAPSYTRPGSLTGEPPVKKKVVSLKGVAGAKKALLKWAKKAAARRVSTAGVEVQDFGKSWRDGIAFNALIHSVKPELVDMSDIKQKSNLERLEHAFTTAEEKLGIPRILEPQDVDVSKPDEKSIMTYVAQFLQAYPDTGEETPQEPSQVELHIREENEEYQALMTWISRAEIRLKDFSASIPGIGRGDEFQAAGGRLKQEEVEHFQAFKQDLLNKEKTYIWIQQQYEAKLLLMLTEENITEMIIRWEVIVEQTRRWQWKIDSRLPQPLGHIATWLHKGEDMVNRTAATKDGHEETANEILQMIQEHKAYFKDLDKYTQAFQDVKVVGRVKGETIPQELIKDLDGRLIKLASVSDHRFIQLQYLEYKYRLLAFLVMGETKLKSWTIKYGKQEHVEQLLKNYMEFIHRKKFFETYDSTSAYLQRVAEAYLADEIPAEEKERVRKFLSDKAAQWKNLSVEIRSVKTMLEEVITKWKKYNECVKLLQDWLEKSEAMAGKPDAVKKEYFQDLFQWQDRQTLLNETGNFLIEITNETVSLDIQQQLLLINGRWKDLFDSVKDQVKEGEVSKMNREYQMGTKRLTDWLTKAEKVLKNPVQVTYVSIKEYVQDLEDINAEIPAQESAIKALSKLGQILVKETPPDQVKTMFEALKDIKDRFLKVRETVPVGMRLCTEMQEPLEALEHGCLEITRWLDQAEKLLLSHKVEASLEQLEERIKSHQQFFISHKQIRSKLEARNKELSKVLSLCSDNMDKSIVEIRMTDIITRFQNCMDIASEWEKKLNSVLLTWRDFSRRQADVDKKLKEAEAVLGQEGTQIDKLITGHLDFFNAMDETIPREYLTVAEKHMQEMPEPTRTQQQRKIQDTQDRWKAITRKAPIRLARLQFQKPEKMLKKKLTETEAELSEEIKLLNAKHSPEKLLDRHKNYFHKEGGFFSICEECKYLMENATKKMKAIKKDDTSLEDAYTEYKMRYGELRAEVEVIYKKILERLQQWSQYRERLKTFSQWLESEEKSLRDLSSTVPSKEEFEMYKAKLETLLKYKDAHAGDVQWLTTTLKTLTGGSQDPEAVAHQKELQDLVQRYNKLDGSVQQAGDRVQEAEQAMQQEEEDRLLEEFKQKKTAALREMDNIREDIEEASQKGGLQTVGENVQSLQSLKPQQNKLASQLASLESMLSQMSAMPGVRDKAVWDKEAADLKQRCATLQQDLQDNLTAMENLQVRWEDFYAKLDRFNSWIQTSGAKLAKVEQATDSPEVLFDKAKGICTEIFDKYEDLEALEKEGQNLIPDATDAETLAVKTKLQEAGKQWEMLCTRAKALNTKVKENVGHWQAYQGYLQQLLPWLEQAERTLRQQLPKSASSTQAEEHVKQQQVFSRDLEEHRSILDAAMAESEQIISKPHLGEEVEDIQNRFTQVEDLTNERATALSSSRDKWREYETDVSSFLKWLEKCESLLKGHVDPADTQKHQAYIQTMKKLQDSVENVKPSFMDLMEANSSLREVASPQGTKALQTQRADLEKRFHALETTIEQKIRQAEGLGERWTHLYSQLDEFTALLHGTDSKLTSTSEPQGAPEDELKRTKAVSAAVQEMSKPLAALEKEGQTLLKDSDSSHNSTVKLKLTSARKQWDDLCSKVKAREEEVSANLGHWQQYRQALDEFMAWLKETEGLMLEDLAKCSCSADVQEFVEQHERTTRDIESHRRSLTTVSQYSGRVQGQPQLHEEVEMLSQHFDRVVRMSKERTIQLDDMQTQWMQYESELKSFEEQLDEWETTVSTEVNTADIQGLQAELDATASIVEELTWYLPTYDKLLGTNQMLRKYANPEGATALEQQSSSIQKRWEKLANAMSDRQAHISALLDSQKQLEQDMGSFSSWVTAFQEELDQAGHITGDQLDVAQRKVKEQRAELEDQKELYERISTKVQKEVAEHPRENKFLSDRHSELSTLFESAEDVIAKREETLPALSHYMDRAAILSERLKEVDAMSASQENLTPKELEKVQHDIEDIKPLLDEYKVQSNKLESSLQRAKLTVKDPKSGKKLAIRDDVEQLLSSHEKCKSVVQKKQEQLDQADTCWKVFLEKEERLLQQLAVVEGKLEVHGAMEPTNKNIKAQLKGCEKLLEELKSCNQDLTSLKTRGSEVTSLDPRKDPVVQEHIQNTTGKAQRVQELLSQRQASCHSLIELFALYQKCKSSVDEVVQGISRTTSGGAGLLREEDVRRQLKKLEEAESTLAKQQPLLDDLTTNGNLLMRQLRATEHYKPEGVKTSLDASIESWLDLGQKVKQQKESLTAQLKLWEEINASTQDFDQWLAGPVSELKAEVTNFRDSGRVKSKLELFQDDLNSHEKQFETLKKKVSALESICGRESSDVHNTLDHISSELSRAGKLASDGQAVLQDFSGQQEALQKQVDDLLAWLHTVEVKLSRCDDDSGSDAHISGLIKQCKDIAGELQSRQADVEAASEKLNVLCRKYQSSDLEPLTQAVSSVRTKYDSACSSAEKVQGHLEHTLDQRFNTTVEELHAWLKPYKDTVAVCTEPTGEQADIKNKLHQIQDALSKVSAGEPKMAAAEQQGGCLSDVLPSATSDSISHQLTSARQEWETLISNAKRSKSSLEAALVQHKDFEEKQQKFDKWLEEAEASVGTEFSLKADLALKKSQMQRFQHIQQDVTDHAAALSGLKEQALDLGSKDSHENNLARKVSLLSGRHQGLTNTIKDILSQCSQQVAQHEEYQQGLQESQAWLEDAKNQLTSLANTSGSREQIEKRLADVQLLLASKQQGELKLNMAVGLGEKTMENTAPEGRSIIQQQLESLRKDWQAFGSSASETKASLENSLLQWGSYQESLDELTKWLQQTESTLDKELPLVADLKEKRAQLNKQQAIHQDIVTHQSLLEKVVEKAGQVTSDSDVSDIREHYAELLTKAQDRVSHMESIVSDHQQYQEALQSFQTWFNPAQEELRGCGEACTERAATQTKLNKLQELQSYVTTGKSMVEHLSSLGDQTLLNTSQAGVKHIHQEIKTAHRDVDQFSRDIRKLSTDLEVLLGEWERYEEMEKELTTWLANMESTLKAEVPLVSTVQEKREQLAKFKSHHEEVMKRKAAIEALSKQATVVMGHQAANVSLGSQVTSITSHFQSLTIISKDLVKKLDQTVTDHEQFDVTVKSTSHWISQLSQEIQRCKANTTQPLETRIKTLKDLGTTVQDGKSKLKAATDKTEKVLSSTAAHGHKPVTKEVERLRKEYNQLDTSLQELQTSVDSDVHQQQEHAEAVGTFSTWLKDLESKLSADVEVGAGLGEKKSQLEKYQALQSEVLEKQSTLADLKQQAAQLKERGGQESASLGQLERRFTVIITRLEEIITMFVKVTTTHTEYQGKVQEAEKWLMLMSNKVMSEGSSQPASLESAQQEHQQHKAVMQEVEAFQSNIDSIRDTGKQLTSPQIPMADVARAKLKKKMSSQLDTIQSSYGSVKTAGQQVQQQLEAAVVKHEQLQESFQAADEWLKEATTAVQGEEPSHASSLEEAQKILQEQKVMLEKTKATESSISALSEDTGDYTDGSTPLQGRLEEVTEQLQHRVTVASGLVSEWEGLEKTKGKLQSFLQEAEKNLAQLKAKPAELSINRAKTQSSQIQELAEEVKSKEAFLKALQQKFTSLSGDNPEANDPMISDLAEHLQQLCTDTAALQAQREEELKAAEEYQDAREQLSSQLEQYQVILGQLDQDRDSSTPVRLDKAKHLVADIEHQKVTIEELRARGKDMKAALAVSDQKLLQDHVSILEEHLGRLLKVAQSQQSQLQTALEHFSGAQFQTAGTQTWLQTMQGRVAAPVVLKLDVQEAQKQLEQYSGLCKEIDERKDSLASMQTFVEELLPNLGKTERNDLEAKLQSIQQQYTQLEKDAKGRRQALGKGVSERRDLLSELEQCQTWLEQTGRKVQTLVEEPVALQPHGVQKQINSCKALQNVVSSYQPNIAEVNSKAQHLLDDLDEDDKVKLDSALEGLQEGNDNLQEQLTTRLVTLESALQDRETFQADLDGCSQWLKQADIATFPEVKLDAALQELEAQLDKHQHISKEASMYDEMLNRLQQQGGAMEAQLNPQDATILRERLVAVEQQFKRVSSKAAEKVSKLEGALEARRDHESQLEQCSQDLKSLQSQLDKINTPIPLSSNDAQSLLNKHRELQEKLASLQPGVEDITKAKEALQTSGHAVSSEEVARLNKEFQKLGQKLQQRCTRLEEAVAARAQYEGGIGEVEESLQHCQEALSNLDQPGTTLGKRVEVGQNLSATVQRSLAALSPLSTRGEEIGAEGTDTDRDTVTTQLAVLKRELQKLQFTVQEKQQECEQRLVEQQDFQGEIDKSLDWLWKTRVEVTRPEPLTLDMQYVQEQLKICQLSQEEVSSQMRMIYALSDKEKSKLESLGEEMPAIMADKLAQVRQLETELNKELAETQAKLESEVELRQKYHEATQSLTAWLEAAEYRLHTGEEGVDFTQAQEELLQHKEFFGDTSTHQDRLTEMQDLAKQMMPVLQKDSMQEVLRSLQTMQSRLTAAEEGAKNKDRTLTRAAEKWQEFQQNLEEVSDLEEQTEEKCHAVDTSMPSSLQAAQERLQEHQAAVSTFPSCAVQLSALQDKARQLEGEADYGTKTAISRALGQLNERWASLQRAATEQQVVLDENRAQWQVHQDQVRTITSSLQQLEEGLPQDQVEAAGLELLRTRAQDTKSLCEDLETVDSSLMEAGQAAQAIIGKLDPESEAAQAVSQEVRQLQHRLSSLTQQTLQYQQAVQEELQDREQLQGELGETISWIQGARSELAEVEGLGPSAVEVQGKLDRQAELKGQLTARLQEVKQLIGQKKEKYKEGDLPPEMSQQIQELTQAEEEVEEELARSSEHLEMAKAVREEFQQDMKDVKSSLVELEKQVSQPIMDINKDKEAHQEMCAALEQLRERLDSLNERAKHLSDDTNDPQEKERLSNIIGPLNEHFSSLEAKSKVKKGNLDEAADLLAEFEDAEKQVSDWLEKGEELVRPGITLDSYDEVCQQQQELKDILDQGEESQPHVQVMREKMYQLSQLCNVSPLLPRLSDVSDRTGQLKVAANQNLKQLTEATDEVQDFEAAVEQLQAKMEESQAKLASPEFQKLPLKERLAAQEALLKDIEAHRAETSVLLERKQRLKVQAADMPACENAQTLQGEVAILHHAAVRQNQAIKEAVNQEVQHEAQVQQLTGAIEEAQKQMEEMPPAGANVEDLKKHLAQHQALAAQVRSYQDQLGRLNEQRQHLAIQGPLLDKAMSIDVLMDRVRSGSIASEDRSSTQSLEPEERGKDSGMSSGASVTSSPMPQVRQQHTWDQARHDMLLGRRLQAYGLPGELVPGSQPSTAASVTSTQSDLTVQEFDQSGAEYMMSLPVELSSETPLSTGDPELDQLNKSWSSLQEQVSSREQQLLQALQHQEEYQQAVSEVTTGVDATQTQLDAVLVDGDDLDDQHIGVQFVLAKLSQLRKGVKKVEEKGQQAAQSTQSTEVEGNVQVTTSDLNLRLASLEDQATAKQKEIEEKLEQQRAHQETLSAYQAEMQALHTWVTSARVQSSIDFITASDREALDEQLEENKRLQSDLEDRLIRLPELQDRCSDLVEKEPPAQAELMFSQLNNLQRDMADLQEALTNREENISQAAEACEQREKELEEYQSRVQKMQSWIAHSKGAAAGEEGVSISVTAATPDSPSETSPEQLFDVAQASADQDTTDTPMEISSDHDKPADETGVAGAEGGARPTSPGSKRAPSTLPSIPEHHSALMRQKGALDEGSPTYEEKQKALDEELAQHKHLLKSIAKKGERILRQRSSTESDMGSSNGSETDMADLKQRWDELAQEIGERKQQLQLALQQNRPPPQLQRKLSMSQFRPPSFDSPGQGETNMVELKNTLDDLHKCWENMQSEMTDSQSRLEEAMDFQQKYQDALEDVSGWLDNIELKLFTSDWSKDSETQLAQNESLRKEIGAFQDQVYVMNRACQQLMVEADSRNRQVVQQTLSDLKDRLHTLEGQALQKEQELIEKNSQWKDFQMEINSLYTWITETKSDIMNDDDDTEYTIQDKLAHLQDIEDDISDHEDQVASILERGREMGDDDPRAPVTMETTMLQSNWDELLRIVNRRKNDLGKAATALQQYEKLLQDYSDFIETAEEKLNTGMLTVTGLEELKRHLEKHSEFFMGLDAQKVLVDSLLQKLDPSTREQYIEQHTGLNHRASNALDRAQRLSQDLDTVAQTWDRFEEEFELQNEWLQETEGQIPVEDMSEDVVQKLQDRVTLYQDHQPVVQRMLDMGNSVLQSVYCPALEAKLSQFEDRWTAANTKTSQELSKLEQLYNQWRTFDKDSTKLIDWLGGAVDKLNKFAEQEPRGIDRAIDDFTDFRKEVDLHQPLKESSTSLGHQLILLKSQQAETVQDRLKVIETNWTQLMGKIPAIEKQLHRTQMEMLPSRQALAEVLLWMDRLEAALQDTHEEDMAAVVELQAVLQKYKGYKIDMSAKQLTVDFINQSVMQSSQGPEDEDFLVKHEAMNTRWEELNNLLQARMDRTEVLLSHAKEFEGRLSELKSWLQEQEAQLKRHQKRSSEAEVQHALVFCQDLNSELKKKNTEVTELEKTAQQQVQGKDNPAAAAIQQDVEAVRQGWTNLQQQVSELQLSLSALADQWKQYYQVQQTITQHLGSTEYTLGRFKPGFGDLETLKKKAEELKELQEEFMAKEDNLVVHGELAAQLMQESDPGVKDRLQREVDQLKARDTECLKAMENRLLEYDQIVELWQQYQDQYSSAKDWVIIRERTFQDLLKTEQKENRSLREEYEELLSELEQYSSELVGLGSLCEQLCAHVENPASAHLGSQCKALVQRLDSLKQQVIKKLEVAKTKAADSQRFEGEVESLQKLLQEAEEVLQSDDPNKSADETTVRDRMDQIKTQMLKFNNYSGQLEDLNSLGYRLALGEGEANQLRDLNQRWYNMSTLMSDKYRTMQGIMLDKQNFAQKCETWMLFLAQTEKDLAVDIAGNYEGLLEQQKAYEIFQADLFSRQQILHSIVSDGQRIMAEEVLEDPEEDLQQRLTLLRDQWQNVLRRSNERKQVIDHRIQQWQLYKSLRTKVLPWMVEMKHEIAQYEFSSLSLERVRAMLEDVEASLKKVTAQEPTYLSLVETAEELMQVSDKQVEGALERELTDIQKEWNDINDSLDHKRHQLESLLQSWSDCEDDIEGCLAWLRDIKRLLTQDVPSNHDELQREMHICKEYETAFQLTENKLTNIHGKEQQLAGSISPEDLSLLQERVRFLRKQWDEIHHQTTLRRQKVTDKL